MKYMSAEDREQALAAANGMDDIFAVLRDACGPKNPNRTASAVAMACARIMASSSAESAVAAAAAIIAEAHERARLILADADAAAIKANERVVTDAARRRQEADRAMIGASRRVCEAEARLEKIDAELTSGAGRLLLAARALAAGDAGGSPEVTARIEVLVSLAREIRLSARDRAQPERPDGRGVT